MSLFNIICFNFLLILYLTQEVLSVFFLNPLCYNFHSILNLVSIQFLVAGHMKN